MPMQGMFILFKHIASFYSCENSTAQELEWDLRV